LLAWVGQQQPNVLMLHFLRVFVAPRYYRTRLTSFFKKEKNTDGDEIIK
jgi:hypothetical protein